MRRAHGAAATARVLAPRPHEEEEEAVVAAVVEEAQVLEVVEFIYETR